MLLQTDSLNDLIRRLDVPSGTVTTIAGTQNSDNFADGVGSAAEFNTPWGISVTNGEDAIVVRSGPPAPGGRGRPPDSLTRPPPRLQADRVNNCIRRIDLVTYAVTTIAGNPLTEGSTDGTGSEALFYAPLGVAVNPTNMFAIVVRSRKGAGA